jgi:hypothetical protein
MSPSTPRKDYQPPLLKDSDARYEPSGAKEKHTPAHASGAASSEYVGDAAPESALTYSVSYAILAITWAAFFFVLSVHETLLRRHDIPRFVEQ